MKKITYALTLLFTIICTAQQGPQNGTVAPDFTATDLNGNVHDLSDYLNAGKTVIVELSGVNCGPCWKYLKTEALSDFYYAYGPAGSNEAVVLMVENSDWTTLDELQSDSPRVFGNWVENTPFPILLNSTVYNLYSTNYVPSIYRICPDGILTQMSQASAISCRNMVNADCGVLTGVQNFARVQEPTTINGFCGATGSFEFILKNLGANPLLNANLLLKENGTVVGTKQFSGQISQFTKATIQFDEITLNPSATYTVEIESVNGVENHNADFSTAILPFTLSNPTGIEIDIMIHTYLCPGNMTWKITNSNGDVVVNGGPYEGYGTNPCGGPNHNTIIEHNVTLPDADECYTMTLLGAGGYGWKNSQYSQDDSTPGVEIFSNGNLIFSRLNVGNFGSSITFENFLTTGEALGGTDVVTTDAFKIYPNPSQGRISIKTDDAVGISIYDVTGKAVYCSEKITGNTIIDLSHLENGVYVAKVTGSNSEITTQKIIISK